MTATSMGSSRVLRALTTASALAALVGLASPAGAAPTAAQRETARRFMDEGKERMRAGEKDRALESYQKAHDLMHVPTTGMALARAHLALGHLVEARDIALEVVRMPRESGEPKVFDTARRDAKELEASTKPRIPTARIVVRGGPATKVTVDDVEIAKLLVGEPMALNPGHHVFGAKNADGAEKRVEMDLAERDAKEVELVLPTATPHVVSVAPPSDKRPSPQVLTAAEPRRERTTTANVLVYGGFGLATAGLVVGGITGAMTLSKASDVKAQCENGICDPSARSALSSSQSLATVSTVGFIAAGVGLTAGIIGLALPKTSTETALQSRGLAGTSFWPPRTASRSTPCPSGRPPGPTGIGWEGNCGTRWPGNRWVTGRRRRGGPTPCS